MDLLRARAFNLRQAFTGTQIAAIAKGLRIAEGEVKVWSDAALYAVEAYQKALRLTADGMVGPNTLRALVGVAASERRVIPNLIHEAAAQFPAFRFGTDISLWNDDIDPSKFDGVSFAILKLSEFDFIDPKFLQHKQTMIRAPRTTLGNYHLPRMVDGTKGVWEAAKITVRDTDAQALAAAALAKLHPAPLGHWLDFEPDSIGDPDKRPRFFSALRLALGGDRVRMAAWVRRWLEVFEGEVGAECGIYLSPRIMKEGGAELRAVLGSRRRWVAAYHTDPKLPVLDLLPDGWDEVWDIWQCRGSDDKGTPKDEGGRCRGIGRGVSSCDQNVMNPDSPLMRLLAAA